MDDKTRLAQKVGAKRVARHAEAQRAKGLVRVPVWVPVADKDRLIAYAAGLRIGAELLLPSDRRMAALLRYGIDPAQESKTAPGRTKQTPATRDNDKPRRKRKRRSDAKPAKKTERTQEQNQPKTPKKKRNQRRRLAQKATRRMRD